MPLDGVSVARLWSEANELRRVLESPGTSEADLLKARHALERLLEDEAELDFGDEAGQPPASIHPDQRVGVLLPLRIETRFRQEAGNWRMQVRLFPEPIAFDQRPRPVPGEARGAETENRALVKFWTKAGGSLDSPDAPAAFRVLADAIGAVRAAWLVRHVKVTTTPGGVVVGAVPAPSPPLAALPPRIGIWLARGGDPALAAVLYPNADEIADQSTIDRLATATSKFDGFWWNHFDVAKKLGLGCEIDLGPTADIDLLIVAGIGTVPAASLFSAHAESGRLGLLAPGAATKTVDGEPTVVLDLSADALFDLVRRPGWAQAGTRQLAISVTGDPVSLPALPGGDVDVRSTPQRAASLLVPGIFGRALLEEWNLGINGHAAARWATRWLLPRGPCPVVRLGDVPYGILPASAPPARWKAASDDPAFEEAMLGYVYRSGAIAASVSETAGNIAGANHERVLELLTRTPVSRGWAARPAITLPVAAVAAAGLSFAGGPVNALPTFDDAARAVVNAGLAPPLPVVTIGDAIPIDRGRTDRGRLRLEDLVQLAFKPWRGSDAPDRHTQDYDGEQLIDIDRRNRPRHLVEYLIDAAVVLTHVRLVDVLEKGSGSINLIGAKAMLPKLKLVEPKDRTALEASGWLGAEIARAWHDVRYALDAMIRREHDRADLVDAAVGLLDAASHRMDPWVTGASDRRLRRLAHAKVPFVVGVYGWVDSPAPAGMGGDPRPGPGPTAGGLIHAPGADHAAAAALLRDRAVHAAGGLWDIELDSHRIRAALRLAAYIRSGITLAEALGREVERILPERVHELRRRFPMRPEAAGRQVCHGQNVIAAAASTQKKELTRLTSAPIAATEKELDEIRALTDAVDAYADLLVTDAAFALVGGQGRIAGASLDAAAGLAVPPEMRAVRTPRRGAGVTTTLLGVLPAADQAPGSGPAGIAAPELAAEIVRRFGGAGAWAWDVGAVRVTLADLGLEPVDVLTLESQTLESLLGRGEQIRSAGGAERVAAAHRLARAISGAAPGPPDLPSISGARADLLKDRATVDLALLVTVVEGDPGLPPLVAAARWGTPLAPDVLAQSEAGAEARRQLIASAAADLASRLARDDDGAPVAARLKNLLGDRVPPPPAAVGSAGALGFGAAIRPFDLDTGWLEPISAVRPEAAAIEAYQLAPGPGASSFHGYVSGLAPWSIPTPGNNQTTILYGPPGALVGESVAVWGLGTWSEVVPSRDHQTHAAFGFNAPDSRAPQAVLSVVPPDLSRPLDEDDLVATIAWVRRLARARVVDPDRLRAPGVAAEVTPLTLLHASGPLHVDPGGTGGSGGALDDFMRYERLEPDDWGDVLEGLRAPVADPLWLLGRQWELGEHRGEDASSPVELRCETSSVPLISLDRHSGRRGAPMAPIDPANVPVEALIEADPESWWTMGRRIRLGEQAAKRLTEIGVVGEQRRTLEFGALSPPYEEHSGAVDGRAVYLAGYFAGDALWEGIPTTPPNHWRPDQLDYAADFGAGAGRVRIDSHDGGEVDWWSCDATASPASAPLERSVLPGRLQYPGAALPRYWQLEDDSRDPSGYPPDAPHWVTALWSDAVSSAGSDWFTAPVPAGRVTIGSIVTLHAARVRDSFDDWWGLQFPRGRGDPSVVPGDRPWSIYRTRGLAAGALVLWPTAVSPLTASAWEEAILGVDEDADLCWAVETRVDGVTLEPGWKDVPPADPAPGYLILPTWGIPAHGHPYRIEGRPEGRRFVQGLVADLSESVPRLRPGPRTSLLPGELRPSAVPSVGIRLVRRWCLARACDAGPVLWLQIERLPLMTGPVSHLRFDVLVPDPHYD
jgi:hypothetical protein